MMDWSGLEIYCTCIISTWPCYSIIVIKNFNLPCFFSFFSFWFATIYLSAWASSSGVRIKLQFILKAYFNLFWMIFPLGLLWTNVVFHRSWFAIVPVVCTSHGHCYDNTLLRSSRAQISTAWLNQSINQYSSWVWGTPFMFFLTFKFASLIVFQLEPTLEWWATGVRMKGSVVIQDVYSI
jgi:hypothetical protein